jgi:hypothetical protein
MQDDIEEAFDVETTNGVEDEELSWRYWLLLHLS